MLLVLLFSPSSCYVTDDIQALSRAAVAAIVVGVICFLLLVAIIIILLCVCLCMCTGACAACMVKRAA